MSKLTWQTVALIGVLAAVVVALSTAGRVLTVLRQQGVIR